jgi:tRNA dimethylallyltransferase
MSGPVIIVAGPTASGKSALALALAERFHGEIVNADSMQVYRELPVLTARPTPADEARVPHHLYGVLSVAEASSAGAWLTLALQAITAIRARGNLPIVCGGTGLYLKVLTEGIAPVPEVPAAVTEEAKQLYAEEGGEAFQRRLALLDADAAGRLAAGDRQRLVRAYAVVRGTGRPLGSWQDAQPETPPLDARFLKIVLIPERAALYARIDARFDAMLQMGVLGEVAALAGRGLAPDLPALKALGVPEFRRHLDGECELAAAADKAKQATRNFAKRQLTWYRHQLAADLRIEDFGGTEAIERAASKVQDFLAAG